MLNRILPFLAGASVLAIVAVTGCQVAQDANTVLAAVKSPAGQAVLGAFSNFNPQIAGIVAKANSGIAASQDDVRMACAAVAWGNAAFKLFAPYAKFSADVQDKEQAGMVAIDAVCANPPADLAAAVTDVVAAYQAVKAQLAAAQVPVPDASGSVSFGPNSAFPNGAVIVGNNLPFVGGR